MEIRDEYIKANERAVCLAVMAYKAALGQGVDEMTAQGMLGTAQRYWLQALVQETAIDFYKVDKMTKGQPKQ